LKRKLVAIAAIAAGAFALMPAQAALAAHPIGGYAKDCIGTNNSAYDKVYVAVDGVGSDNPRNWYAAGTARITATATCAVPNGINAVRVQIDRLALLEYVGGSTTITRKAVGPVHGSGGNVVAQTPGWHSPCSANLQVSVRFSVRYANGALSTGGFLTGPVFRRC
jgi:hypothetical protein